jgi:hypothetical protein
MERILLVDWLAIIPRKFRLRTGHETGRILSTGFVGGLRERENQYERNILPAPLVYRLSDKASPGSYALTDKR